MKSLPAASQGPAGDTPSPGRILPTKKGAVRVPSERGKAETNRSDPYVATSRLFSPSLPPLQNRVAGTAPPIQVKCSVCSG